MNPCVCLGQLLWGMGAVLWYCVLGILSLFVPNRFLERSLKGKVVVITGAASGIGKLLAEKLALKEQCKVICWDVNGGGNSETVADIERRGGQAVAYTVNLMSQTEIEKSAADVLDKEGGNVDILINNAGILVNASLIETRDEILEKIINVNVLAVYRTTKAFLPHFLARDQGHIVNMSSLAGVIGFQNMTAYTASKHAVVGLTESLRMELMDKKSKVRTTVVCPSIVRTPMFQNCYTQEQQREKHPFVTVLEPQEVVDKLIQGVKMNRRQVLIPSSTRMILELRNCVPDKAYEALHRMIGIQRYFRLSSPPPAKDPSPV